MGYVETHIPPKIGLMGNHQIQYFNTMALDESVPEHLFFNYWYADLALPETRDYLQRLKDLKKLPTELVIVAITTPNNDNGRYIINYGEELPKDIARIYQIKNEKNFLKRIELKFMNYWMIFKFNKDWKAFISGLYDLLSRGSPRYLLMDYGVCQTEKRLWEENSSGFPEGAQDKNMGLKGHLKQIRMSRSEGEKKLIQSFCDRERTLSYRFDGSSNSGEGRGLTINSNALTPSARDIKNGDEVEIARLMNELIDLVEDSKRKLVFLIPPVYETDRPSVVDDIFSASLEMVPEANVIDHRKKFRERQFFSSYDHPNENYFREVAKELRERKFLDGL
ncbi:MAG: hypothetical protein G3M78_01040 [Candidatus Nitrohelix vancouverensis]|uniref:Uncharacterized protein n=1 Tax=Candidatus Nitrohelix vancouverensis TaxID=2705534 RepID=A0A7T0C044_9BACT|nr:MAG: hypothetical protein G3M78_01040 [Candidatus Nitrohelix vancouverensis]